MNITQITKAIAPLVKLVESETAVATKAENRQLKSKLKKALEQRDEWRYQAQKYQATILELKKGKA
jgi:hypothetical protein